MSDPIVFVPWYEPEDYYSFRSMNGGKNMPPSYEDWMNKAVREVMQLLARGTATQIVRLRPGDYFRWLVDRCAADNPAERLAYLALLHGQSGCPAAPGSLAPHWPQTATIH